MKKKRLQIHLALPSELLERVKLAAKADGRSITNWIERAILRHLKLGGQDEV